MDSKFSSDKYILLTIDVEDWFQVENLRPWNPPQTWNERELRVEKSTHRILDLLDSVPISHTPNQQHTTNDSSYSCLQPTTRQSWTPLRATFFVLGWIARRLPNLVREIQDRGHEVASHGDNHLLCTDLSSQELERDLQDSKSLLEDICGQEVIGYRAPSFSISESILKKIMNAGYKYDSSYNSFALHNRYGRVNFQNAKSSAGNVIQVDDGFYEVPISNLNLGKRVLPWGGGGYFRLMPTYIFVRGIKQILSKNNAYVFYMHPWEFDPDQPRVKGVSRQFGFRHYVNLHKTESKLQLLIDSLPDQCSFVSCLEYLETNDFR